MYQCRYIVRWLFYYLQPAAAPRKYDIIFTRNKYIIILYTVSYIFLIIYVLSLEETKYPPDRPKVLARKKKKKCVSPPGPGLMVIYH